MKHFFILLASLCWSGLLTAQDAFSLEEAVEYAVQQNADVRLSQLDVAAAEGRIQETLAQGLPQVDGTIDYQYFIQIPVQLLPAEIVGGKPGEFVEVAFGTANNLSASANLNTLVFDATFFIGLKAAKLYRSLVAKQLNQSEVTVRENVTKAYLSALIATRNREIVTKNIDNLDKTLSDVRATYEEGFAEKLDVDRLELSLSNLQNELESLEGVIELNYNLLKFQMGYPVEEAITLTDDIDVLIGETLVTSETLLDEPLQVTQRAEYQVLEGGERLNEMDIQRIKSGYYPNLYAFGSYSQSLYRNNLFDSDANGWLPSAVVGATLNIPIFDSFMKKAQIDQAQIELEKTQVQKEQFVRSANMQVTNARISYRNAMRTVDNLQASLELAEEIYETTQIKFREGVGSSVEVSQAEADLYAAQSDYINALYDLLVARTDLEVALGTL